MLHSLSGNIKMGFVDMGTARNSHPCSDSSLPRLPWLGMPISIKTPFLFPLSSFLNHTIILDLTLKKQSIVCACVCAGHTADENCKTLKEHLPIGKRRIAYRKSRFFVFELYRGGRPGAGLGPGGPRAAGSLFHEGWGQWQPGQARLALFGLVEN